jgi:hypothetical protein
MFFSSAGGRTVGRHTKIWNIFVDSFLFLQRKRFRVQSAKALELLGH